MARERLSAGVAEIGDSMMRQALGIALLLLLPSLASAQTTIHVASGGNLQTALNTAVAGDTVTLEAGATFTGNFTLPTKAGVTPVTVRTVTSDAALPTGQINPTTLATFEPLMASIVSANSTATITTLTSSSNWAFRGVIFQGNHASLNIVILGDNAITSVGALPTDFTFDRCVFRSTGSAHRGLLMNAADMKIRKSYFSNIRSAGVESHSLASWNSPGPFLIEDNYIEAAAIGVLFGGALSGISGNVQSDITFRRNYVTRDLAWHDDTGFGIKNLFELKNAQRVTITGNVFENNWPDSQAGYAIVFTVRANSPDAGWTTIRDVSFENNIVRHTAMAFNILGLDNQTSGCTGSPGGVCPSLVMRNVIIRNNLIYDLDRDIWTNPAGAAVGNGAFALIGGGPENLTIDNNTMAGDQTGNMLSLVGVAMPGFVVTDNIFQKVTGFGVFGDVVGEGNAALNTFTMSDRVFTGNVLAGTTASQYNQYTTGNVHPSVATLAADYVNAGAGNYRLVAGSAYVGKGADLNAIEVAMGERHHRVRVRIASLEKDDCEFSSGDRVMHGHNTGCRK